MNTRIAFLLLCLLCLNPAAAMAWWDMGHMQVAAVAYGRLTPAVQSKVDALIKLHPANPMWVQGLEGLPPRDVAQAAFVHAATWADDIKDTLSCATLHRSDCYTRGKVTDPTAGQNVGTSDRAQHDYWHFYDIPFSTDGSAINPSPAVNALSQIRVLTAALGTKTSSEDLLSYDLVWLLHLVGDAHQPLHAVSRFTQQIPGDQGGNLEKADIGTSEPVTLHAVWDGMLGDRGPASAAIAAASSLPPADPKLAVIADPEVWFNESAALAQKYAYTSEIGPDKGPYQLSDQYLQNAKAVAQKQVALAGARLANLINAALK